MARAISVEQLQGWRAARQRLDGVKRAGAAELLEATGWSRSVGGSGPYLALHARGGISREQVDAAVAALEIHELPSARGCTYVVPKAHFALALRAGQGHGDAAELATARKLGVTDAEIDKLCRGILDALAKGPLDPKQLKETLGPLSRHLGDAGKKRGMATTLPLGLGSLQQTGEIRRVPLEGRLDRQRYAYARWTPNPLAKSRATEEETARGLAEQFFRWAAPATVAQLAWWAGLTVKAARAAAQSLALVPLDEAGGGGELLMFADDRDSLRAYKAPKQASVALVGSLDNLFHLRRELASVLDAEDGARKLPGDKRALSSVLDLSDHAIVCAGQLVGLWQYDVPTQSIVWLPLARAASRARAVEQAVAETERFVRDQLGDARSFSLDSPESRADRIALLRKLKKGAS
jgi:hypothetical protein